MLSLHDFNHVTVWGQALLFGFPTYLGARAFPRRERLLYFTLTAVVTLFSMCLVASQQHDADDQLARANRATDDLKIKVGQFQNSLSQLSGDGAFPVIESGLTSPNVGTLIMWNFSNSPLIGVKVKYSCNFIDSPLTFSEDVGTVPANRPVDLKTVLPLQACRAIAATSPSTPPMAAWEIIVTAQNGQFLETLLFRRGNNCPQWDWTAQIDQVPGVGVLKNGKEGPVGQNKLLWHTDGWINQKCDTNHRYGATSPAKGTS